MAFSTILKYSFFSLILLNVCQLKGQIFDEDFNTVNALSNWTLIDNDARTPASPVSYHTNAWVMVQDSAGTPVDSCVSSTSWYSPAGAADDWLISPAITLTNNNVLSFDAKAQDARFPDGYELRISTSTPTISAFNANSPLLVIAAENASWTRRALNLQNFGYANQTVHLAWVNKSNNQFVLRVDNIKIDSSGGSDLKIISANNAVNEYHQIPITHYSDSLKFEARISNSGTDTAFSAAVVATVKRNGVMVFADTSTFFNSIAPGDTLSALFNNGYTPAQRGAFFIEYEVISNSSDIDSTNNIAVSDTIQITDSTFARGNGVATGSLGIAAGVSGELGSIFTLSQNDTLTSVTVFILNGNGSMTNQPLSVNVRDFNGLPDSIIASSDTITYTSPGSSFVTLTFNNQNGEVPLRADTFFVAVVEGDSIVSIGTTSKTFTPNTSYFDFQGNPGGGWTLNEQFNFRVTYMINPNFGANSIITSTNQIKLPAEFSVFPNPSTGLIFIEGIEELDINNTRINIYNLTGQKMIDGLRLNSQQLAKKIQLSHLEKGIYFLELNNGKESITKKVIIQ